MIASPRRAARVLLVDGSCRVLLLSGIEPSRPDVRYWFTPGGGLEDGESPAEAAARELAEEIGLQVTPQELGSSVWHETVDFQFEGVWHRQVQDFFLVRVASCEVSGAGFNDFEKSVITGHRWWLPEELTISSERYYPDNLPALLAQLVHRGAEC